MRSYLHVQRSISLLYYQETHTLDQLGSTTVIHVNATRSYTTSSAHVMLARESHGFRAFTSYNLLLDSNIPARNQLHYVDI